MRQIFTEKQRRETRQIKIVSKYQVEKSTNRIKFIN